MNRLGSDESLSGGYPGEFSRYDVTALWYRPVVAVTGLT